jgi:outer membrane protein OmpA-like peptidoglycan-associated protein
VVLQARAGTDSHFIGWSGPCSGTEDCVMTIQGAARVGVEFAHNEEKRSPMVVEKEGDGEGEVVSDPSGISCGKVCNTSYRTDQEVRFVAVPGKDSRFAGWEGACSGVEPCTVVVRGEPHLKARFIKAQIVVTPQKLDLQGNVIHFETAKSVIDVDSYYLLDEVVVILKQYPQMRLRIEGHTDAVPYYAPGGNLQLSKDRAASVVQYLVEHGILGSRLTSEGFGLTCPVATNQTAAGRQANRRTEFLVVDPKTGQYQRTPCVSYTSAPRPLRPIKAQPAGAGPRKTGAAPGKQLPLQKAPTQ